MPLKTTRRFFGLGLFLLCVAYGRSQEMEVPVNVQYAVLHKILAFDRNLKARAGSEIVVGILYQSGFRSSLNCKDELLASVKRAGVDKFVEVPLRFVAIELNGDSDVDALAVKHQVDIFYLAPMRGMDLQTVIAVSRARKILTFTGVIAYVEAGLTAGIGVKGDNPRLIINLPAAKAEGADFDAQLLKLAKIIE